MFTVSFYHLSRGPEESLKSSWEPFGELIEDDSSMVVGGNQEESVVYCGQVELTR